MISGLYWNAQYEIQWILKTPGWLLGILLGFQSATAYLLAFSFAYYFLIT